MVGAKKELDDLEITFIESIKGGTKIQMGANGNGELEVEDKEGETLNIFDVGEVILKMMGYREDIYRGDARVSGSDSDGDWFNRERGCFTGWSS